jgi:hypothetical protein
MKELWTCPKCKRQFEKRNQVHSCNLFSLDKHFKGKEEVARSLYNELKEKIESNIGPFNVESLPCCIHFVSSSYVSSTFAAVYALKNKIRIHFALNHKLESPRNDKSSQVSNNRYMHSIDIEKHDEIDEELISWLGQAYHLKSLK